MRFQNYNNLRIFNLAARYGSFTAAAQKLNLTKGAVSYQIKGLESELGFFVFHRLPNGVELTPKGKELQATLQPTFEIIEKKIGELRHSDNSTLTIGVPTYFASRCLSPLLMNFMSSHPKVRLRIQPITDIFDIKDQGVDLAIRWGRGDWTDMLIEPLMRCPAFPVGNKQAAESVKEYGLEKAFENFTLLDDRDSSNAWTDWHAKAGLPFQARADTLTIPDPNVRVQAVIDGQGVSLNDNLIEKELSEGKLYRLSDFQLDSYGYFLAYPPESSLNPDVETFSCWLSQELN